MVRNVGSVEWVNEEEYWADEESICMYRESCASAKIEKEKQWK